MSLVRLSLLGAALLCACESKITSETVDPVLKGQLQTIAKCFPQLFAKGQDVLDLAETWRMNTNGSIPDPPGVVHTGSGPIDVTYDVGGCTITMQIRFYSPAGAEQTGIADTATTLADKIDEAATELRNLFTSGQPFLVGDWTIAGVKGGDTFSGSGALTGIIGGSTNQNELEELRTTTASPSGGPPPNADNTLQEGACTLTFNTTSLRTDESPTQEYPIGTLNVTIDDSATAASPDVTATMQFDGSAVVRIAIDGVDRFNYNVDTRALTAL
jgi:hypothetical protein